MADHELCAGDQQRARASFSFSACLSPSMWFCESQSYPALSVSEWPVWFYDFEVHVAPRCQLPVDTILQLKLASGYNSGSRLAAHPMVDFDQGLVALFAAT